MLVYKMKVIDRGFVKYLPTRHSEISYFDMTTDQAEAQAFKMDDFEYTDLEWVRDCYNSKSLEAEDIQVELITTLATEQEEEELRSEEYDRYAR